MNNTRFSLALFLTLALVGAQAIVLQHDHAGYLSQHADCSICIKQSAESDALPETDSAFDVLGQEVLFSAELGSPKPHLLLALAGLLSLFLGIHY